LCFSVSQHNGTSLYVHHLRCVYLQLNRGSFESKQKADDMFRPLNWVIFRSQDM